MTGSPRLRELQLESFIFATDFSECSQNAGIYAALLAKYFGAKLLVAHAFTLSQAAMDVELEHSISSQQRKDLLRDLTEKCDALARASIDAVPVLLEGDPKDVLPALADKNAPSIIVLGTHGGGWLEREVIGSVAEKILWSTCWPCLTVGPRVQPVRSTSLPFRRILYSTDFTGAAAHAAWYAVLFAKAVGAEMDVLHVVQHGDADDPERLNNLRESFHKSLEENSFDGGAEILNPIAFVPVGNAHREILRHVRERSIDLLVLGIDKTSHLGLQLRASGAFQLIVDVECPVLTIAGRLKWI